MHVLPLGKLELGHYFKIFDEHYCQICLIVTRELIFAVYPACKYHFLASPDFRFSPSSFSLQPLPSPSLAPRLVDSVGPVTIFLIGHIRAYSRTSGCDHFSYVTTSPQRPVFKNTKSFPVISLDLEPLVSDHF